MRISFLLRCILTLMLHYCSFASPATTKSNFISTSENSFKHKIFKSLNEAITETSKSEKTFLIIMFDPNANLGRKKFNEFIQGDEKIINEKIENQNIDLNNPEVNEENYFLKFNYYLANKEEIKLLISDVEKPRICILNNEKGLLYSIESTIDDFSPIFDLYYNLTLAYKRQYTDYHLNNSQETLTTLQKIVKSTFKDESGYNDSYQYNSESEGNEEGNEQTNTAEESNNTEDNSTEESENDYENADDNYVDIISDQKFYYQIKTSKEEINKKFSAIFNEYKNKPFNKELAIIIYRELINNGFNRTFYDYIRFECTPFEIELLNYLIKHESQLKKVAPNDPLSYINIIKIINYELISSSKEQINTILLDMLDKQTENLSTGLLDRVGYIGNRMMFTNDHIKFEALYNQLTQNNTSIVESLNNYFLIDKKNKEKITMYQELNWEDYKYEFSNLLNIFSWSVVVSDKDSTNYSKALKWSQDSLKLEPNNSQNMITLAHLYYLTNQKEKAINWLNKAIEIIKNEIDTDSELNTETLKELNQILLKMKKGASLK